MPYVRLESRPGLSRVSLAGVPVAQWGPGAPGGLRATEDTQTQGSWFSRNWWLVGLGVVAVGGGIALAASGGDSDDSSGGNNNCGVSGSVVGPNGVQTDTNCTR